MAFSGADSVLDYLDSERVHEADWESVLRTELLALSGWAGLMRRIEEDAALAQHQFVPALLMDFLAVRLTMARVAARMAGSAQAARVRCARFKKSEAVTEESPLKTQEKRHLSRAARIYDAARVVSLSADEVSRLSDAEWAAFVNEVKGCNGLERRRILHLAYERWHEREILRGLGSHRRYRGLSTFKDRPVAQVFFCIDEREESARRALEEVDPQVETFSSAGYFGIAVNYKGIDDSQGAAFCPVVVKPQHAVVEQSTPEDSPLLEQRRLRKRLLGRLMQYSFLSSRSLLRGWVSTAALGLLSSVPLMGHLLAPRRYAQLRAWMNKAALWESSIPL